MSEEEPLEVALKVAEVLEELEIPYLICGSLASSLHGIPRATQDIDILADLTEAKVPRLASALECEFYLDAERMRDAILRRASFNLIHLATMLKIDVFILEDDPQSREELRRRQSVSLGTSPASRLWVASAEDTVVQKLVWYELGGGVSERQWRDVVGILKVQRGRLDLDYLQQAAAGRNIAGLLARVLKDAGSEPLQEV